MRPSALLPCLSLLLLAGCATPFRHRDYNGDGTGVGRKLVVEKREQSVLVAFDYTICMVDPKRYREVQVRDAVWCNWRRDGGGDATTVVPDGSVASNGKSPVEEATTHPTRRTARPRSGGKTATSAPAKRPAKKDD